jgi:uncharacterized protein
MALLEAFGRIALFMTGDPCILIGASVRAAAFSALRAGLVPWCLDLFADADLRAAAACRRLPLSAYPSRLPDILRDAPAGPVIFTGGLENHWRLIGRIARERGLWGNSAESLRRCRNPFFVAKLLTQNGLRCPEVSSAPRHTNGPMLRKPLRSAGGANIRPAQANDATSRSFYYQRFIPGRSFAAVFCAFAERVELLGVTEQLVGDPRFHAPPYRYCGSIGPVALPESLNQSLRALAELLRTGCGLRGLFGVDFIIHEDQVWPLEVNPRYTASIEVLEYATGQQALMRHREAFTASAAPLPPRARTTRVGKAIVFAPQRLVFRGVEADVRAGPAVRPDYADIPHPRETIEAGWPILTLFAEADSVEECRRRLYERAQILLPSLTPL